MAFGKPKGHQFVRDYQTGETVCLRCGRSEADKKKICGRQKFNAEAVISDGKHSPSKLEHSVFFQYELRQRNGEIRNLTKNATVHLLSTPLGVIKYKSDGGYEDDNGPRWIEAKGVEGERWRIIRKLWSLCGPGPLEVWKGNHKRPGLSEVIIPDPEVVAALRALGLCCTSTG